MKQQDEGDCWICQTCGHSLKKHHCPAKEESKAVSNYIDTLVLRNIKLKEALLLVAECNYDNERKIKDVPVLRELIGDNYT